MNKAVIWNLLGTVATMLTMVVTVPLFLRFYGPDRYGVIATLWVVLGYFSFLDFGMGPAIINFLSKPEEGDKTYVPRIFWTGVLLNTGTGLVVGGIVILGLLLVRTETLFSNPIVARELGTTLPWLIIVFPVALVYPILVGALDARQNFGIANANQVAGSIAFQVLPLLAVIVMPATLSVAVGASVLGRLGSALALMMYASLELKVGRPRFDRAIVRKLATFGGWVALSSAASSLLETADRLVVGGVFGPASAAWYSISYNVVSRVRSLPYAVVRALFPRIAAGSQNAAQELAFSAQALLLILVPAISVAIIVVEPAFRIWIGGSAAANTVPIARIMLVGMLMNCLAHLAVVALQAGGRPARLAMVHIIELPVFLLVMWLATRAFGLVGAATIWSARLVLDGIILFIVAKLERRLLALVLLQNIVPLVSCVIMMSSLPFLERAALAMVPLAIWAVWSFLNDDKVTRSIFLSVSTLIRSKIPLRRPVS
ncbi:oligosaccharide flippase family protein [Sphingomonadaceae bacterium jetA1]|uniref:oligosaccharide flippase family protein n=1 Tax=Facivitalis istanbulensis TaxID=3075838 RepID=UPI00347F14D0